MPVNPWVLIGIGFAILSGWASFAWERNELQDLRLAVQTQKTEAATELAAEEAKRTRVENEFWALKDDLAEKDAKHNDQMDKEKDRTRALADELSSARDSLRAVAGRGAGGGGRVPGDPDAAPACLGLQAAYDQLSRAMGAIVEGGNGLSHDADGEAGVAALGSEFAVGVRSIQKSSY